MDAPTAQALLAALRATGRYSTPALAAAEAALTPDFALETAAEVLFNQHLVTGYQSKKIRAGNAKELLFGPFLVLDKLGEGGMGKVYRAVLTQPLPEAEATPGPTPGAHVGRDVALKIIRYHLASNRTVLKRYEREAAAVAALDHENIVKLFAAADVQGRYYLAMEYVDGIDLARLMREFGAPPESGLTHYQEACEYIRQAALGLQHAHSRGLIHRDIKPANLLVSGDRPLPGTGGQAVVKILDMGLVRSTEDDGHTDLTRDGTVVGTPDYMSPEQAKNSKTVDGRADLYSLGCAMYYLLRGRPPYPDGTPIDKLLRHQLDPPPDIRRARPDLPGGVAEIVTKLMQKRPEARFQTAAELADALAPFSGTAGSALAFEPFQFTNDPEAIITTPAPLTTPQPPNTKSAKPSAPRLRVKTRPPALVPIPKPPEAPSSDSLNSMARTTAPTPAKPVRVAGRARRPARAPADTPTPVWVWWLVGIASSLATGLVLLAILSSRFRE